MSNWKEGSFAFEHPDVLVQKKEKKILCCWMQTELSHAPFESVHVDVRESDKSLARVKLSKTQEDML